MKLIAITDEDYQHRVRVDGSLPNVSIDVWLKQLRTYRNQLESAWSEETVHPSYIEGFDASSSRGQCGVSSVWLARELYMSYGLESAYCYGDLTFDDHTLPPVRHHCWIEIGQDDDSTRLVIDLTCDQAEQIDDPVLCAPHDKLVERGLRYVSRNRLGVHELHFDRVWHRYERLSDALNEAVESADKSGYTG